MNEILSQSIFFGIAITLVTYEIGLWIKQKTGKAIANPLLISVILIVAVLLLFHIDYETYANGAQYISIFLTPATVSLAVPTIAAILFMVAYNMCDWRKFIGLCKTAPKSDIIVLVTTFVLTVVFDLVVAIEVGILLAAILFMKRMSDVTEVEGWKYVDDEDDADSLSLRVVPHNTMVYEVSGPLFFGAADKILKITLDEKMNCLVLRMRSVSAIDATAMHNLEQLYADCKKKNIQIILSHVGEQPMHVMEKSGFLDKVGRENVCAHIDDALERAAKLQ